MLQACCKISRLKGFFRKNINYSNYAEMIQLADKKNIGNLPSDIISCLLSNNTDKKSAIQGVENLFTDMADILGGINKLEKQAINRMSLKEILKMIKEQSKSILRKDSLYKDSELETIIKAEETCLKQLKKYIPDVDNVIISHIGNGEFGMDIINPAGVINNSIKKCRNNIDVEL